MTSNLGSHVIMELGQCDPEAMRQQVDELLHRQFRPEFLNRVDEIITFHGLSRDDLTQIIDIQIARMTKRLDERKLLIELTDAAKQFLVNAGYDPADPSSGLFSGRLKTRCWKGGLGEGDNILIDKEEEGRLVFKKKSPIYPSS